MGFILKLLLLAGYERLRCPVSQPSKSRARAYQWFHLISASFQGKSIGQARKLALQINLEPVWFMLYMSHIARLPLHQAVLDSVARGSRARGHVNLVEDAVKVGLFMP